MTLTTRQAEIIHHTLHRAAGGLYCGDSPEMQELVTLGFMEMAGRKSFVPDPYFRCTGAGRAALKEYEDAQPKPEPPKLLSARKRRARERYRRWQEADTGLPFREFIKQGR